MVMVVAGHRKIKICSCPPSTTSWKDDGDDDGGCRSQKENLLLSSEYNKLQEMMMMMMVAGHGRKICSCPRSTTSCRSRTKTWRP